MSRDLLTRAPTSDDAASSTELARVFTDDADHGIVQARLGLFYGVLGALVLSFWLAGVLASAVVLPRLAVEIHTSAAKIIHLLAGLGLVTMWLVCRRARLLSRIMLTSLDIFGTVELVAAVGLMLVLVPKGLHTEFLVLPFVLLVTLLRAAIVPSPPRWTALLASITAVPAPLISWLAVVRDPAWNPAEVPRGLAPLIVAVWSAGAVAAAFVVSRVVYGLRAEVKKAMRLGQYTLEHKIGEGGMGVVYRARHALLRRPTAIKLLSTDRASLQDIRRFEREVQLTSMLTHPNTVAVYDFGHTRDGVFYYAMEHLDGLSLHDLVERDGPQPSGRVIHMLEQIAGALSEAHSVGLVHRDVKPANIFLCERGNIPDFVKVLDFGLVKRTGQSDPKLSSAGAIAGTPHYMAPESITDPGGVDERVDLYALGAVGYFLLTGETPFDGSNLVEICSHHLHTIPDPPSQRLEVPVEPKLEAIVMGCLAKQRDERPASAAAVIDMLRACQSGCGWNEAAARVWWSRERASKVEKPGANGAAHVGTLAGMTEK